jgi:hypothetical protein
MPGSLPSFEKLQAAYPQGEWDDVLDLIFKPEDMKWLGNNTCTIRLSHSLNMCGTEIPAPTVVSCGVLILQLDHKRPSTFHGTDVLHVVINAKQVIYAIRVAEMRKYVVARFGEASTIINRPTKEARKALAGKKGVISFNMPGVFTDATGHLDLWDGVTFNLEGAANHDYFAVSTQIKLWSTT